MFDFVFQETDNQKVPGVHFELLISILLFRYYTVAFKLAQHPAF